MRTVIYGDEPVYAYHKIINGERVAINVDKDGKEVNVVFALDRDCREFDYHDWSELDYYKPKDKTWKL